MTTEVDSRQRAIGLIGPVAFASGSILADFGPFGVPLAAGARSLVLAIIIAAAFYIVALMLTRGPHAAASLSTLALVAVWSGPLAVCLALILVAAWRTVRLRRRTLRMPWPPFAAFMRSTSLVFVASGLVILATNGSVDAGSHSNGRLAAEPGPPIYLILLDAYPRADVLSEWGFDNEPFLSGLTVRGFDVARSSTSNYTVTQHTLATMLSMRHLDEIDELKNPPPDFRGRIRLLSQVIAKGGSVLAYLRQRGYDVATVPSIVQNVTIWGAHRLGSSHINDYEIHLINDTDLGRAAYGVIQALAPTWLEDNQRAGVRDVFATLLESQAPGRFIWAHVMSPHKPYVFGPKGEPRPLAACFPSCAYWTRHTDGEADLLIEQVQYLNQLVLDTLDAIDQDAVVIVMSDHGSGAGDGLFRNLIAVRAPGHPDLLPDDATAITVLPRVFNAYFHADLPLPRDDHYFSGPGVRLDVQKWP